MSKSLKKLLPILALTVALAALIAVYVIVKNRPEESGDVGGEVLLVVAQNSEINDISYTYGGESFEFVRDADENWTLKGEEEFPLDQNVPTLMAGCLGRLEADMAVEMNGNLSDYGLDYPEIVITYTADSGESRTFSVGDAYPYGDQRYVSADDDSANVYIVTSLLADDFEKGRTDLFADITLATDEASTDTGMAYSYIVDYRSDNFGEYGLKEGAEELIVAYEITESSEVETTDDETGETITETVTEEIPREAVFYVGDATEDGLYYYVNPAGTDYTIAVSSAIIDSLRVSDETDSDADAVADTEFEAE